MYYQRKWSRLQNIPVRCKGFTVDIRPLDEATKRRTMQQKKAEAMKILIACEYSGIVRDAFIARGHDAMSCDLLPTESPGPHYQGSVLDILENGWNMMIAHPPCTYLSYAATSSWNNSGRITKRLESLEFFRKLWEAPIDRICIENPIGCASPVIAKYHQVIDPYQFGDSARKRTCLWLKNLPLLVSVEKTDLFNSRTFCDVPEPSRIEPDGKKSYFTASAPGAGADRAKNRAKFWPGIAAAMAEQWGKE
jgi:hypothetical protein